MGKKLIFNLHFMNSNLKLQSRERLRVALDTQPEICMEVEWPQVKKKLQERLEKKGLCNSKVQYYHGTALKELRDSSSLSHLLGLHRDALLGDTLELPLYVVPDPTAGSALLDNRAKEIVLQVNQPGGLVQLNLQSDILLGEGGFGKVRQAGDKEPQIDSAAQSSFPSRPQGSYMQKELIVEVMPKKLLFNLHFMNSNLKLQSRERLRVALDTQPEICMEVEWPQVKKKLQERLEKKGLCNSKVQYYHGTALKELRDSSSLSHLLGLHRDALLGDTLELPLYVVPDPTAGSALLDNRAKEIVLQVNQPGGLVQLNLQSDILLGEGGFGKVRQAGDKEPQIDSAAQSSFPSRPQGSYMQKELIVEVMPKKLLFNLHFMNSNLKLQSRERLRVALDTQPEICMEVEWPQVKKKLQERLEKKGLCNSKVQYYHGTALKELRDSSSLSHLLGLHRDALLGDTLELPLYVVPDPTAGSALLDNRAKEIVLQVNQPGGLVQLNLQSDILLGEGGFGRVWRARNRESQIFYAVKISFPDERSQENTKREIETLIQRTRYDPNVVNSLQHGYVVDPVHGRLPAFMMDLEGWNRAAMAPWESQHHKS